MSIVFPEQSGSPAPVVTLTPDASGRYVIAESEQLFSGTFQRSGANLSIFNEGAPTLFLPGYFASDRAADLFDPKGAVLRGDVVELLAGPIAPAQYAQLAGGIGASPIGQVETLDGGASVQRVDGSVETLVVGSKIFQQDVIQTVKDGSVSVTFVDGTIFTLASQSRMVIDELIYDPDANDNSASFNLIQGGFVFIAGQVAKTGGMDVGTPSSTMGIRGTTVVVEIANENGVFTSEITLTTDPDGDKGSVLLYDNLGNLIANITETQTKWVVTGTEGFSRELARTPQDDLEDSVLIAEAFAAFRAAISRVEAGDTFVTLSDPGNISNQLQQGDGFDGELDVDGIDDPEAINPLDEIQDDAETDDFSPIDDTNLLEEDVLETPTLIAVQGFEDATEDSAISGQAVVQNPDGLALVFGLAGAPSNGVATVNPDGSFSFVPDPDFNGTDSFTYFVNGPTGELAQGTVVVEVLPVNDAPVASDATRDMTEDSFISGTIDVFDVDGDTLSYALQGLPMNGEVLLLQNGTYTYTPDLNFEGNDTFSVLVSDPDGANSLATIAISVTGENDAPVIVTAVEDAVGAVTEDQGTGTTGGLLEATDADLGAVLTWTGDASGVFGEFSINATTGQWSYVIDAEAADALDAGQQVTESFTATVTDENGASDSIDVVMTLTGTNDQPVLTTTAGNLSGNLDEDGAPAQVSGLLQAEDADASHVLTWSTDATPVYGTFSVLPDGNWTYTLDLAAAQELAQGEIFDEVLSVSVSDGIGAPVSQTVVVSITGDNDAPFLTTLAGGNLGTVTEASGTTATSGILDADDVGNGATITWSGTSLAVLGTFSLSANGAWSYTLDPGLADGLAEGETAQEIFEAVAEDEFGASVAQSIIVTVTGTNDGPVIVTAPGEDEGALTEDVGLLETGGKLDATDVDGTVQWSGSTTGLYGAFVIAADGAWTYTLDPATVQFLAEGQQTTDTFEAFVTDGLSTPISQFVTITITGTNDAPVITSAATDAQGALTEGEELITATGTLAATDPDVGQTPTWSAGAVTADYGEFELLSNGEWSYTLDNALADELQVGETVVETLVAIASDGVGGLTEETIEVTITGTNDRPIVNTNTIFETIQGQAVSGTLVASDVDGDVASLSFSIGALEPVNGTLTINPDGSFLYTPDAGFLGVERFEYLVDDGQGGVSTARATIEVESDPDDPANDNVSIGLNTDADADAAAGSVEIGINAVEVTSVNLAIALDRSTSIGFLQWQDLLNSVKQALTDLAAQFEGSDTTVDVKIITFATDVDVTSKPDGSNYQLGEQELLDLINPIDLPYRGGSTSWDLAFIEAGNFFFSEPSNESNVLLFVTDGVPTSGTYIEPLNELRDTTDDYDIIINAFGFGEAYQEDDLLLIDDNATFLTDSSQLEAAFATTPIFNPELLSLRVELEADDGAAVLIADETSDALIVEGTNFELPLASIDNILSLLGESNRINITAQFDVDNDTSDAEIELFSTEVIGKSDTAQTSTGLDGADLIFGSDFADNLSGGAGNDILVGFDGDDTLDGGSGNDTIRAGGGDDRIVISDPDVAGDDIDGGAGRDTLAIDAIADINTLLGGIDLSGVEALDIANSQQDDLILTYDDVLQLSDTGDDVLNQYLGVTSSNSLSIYGDANDTLELDGGAIYDIELTGQVVDGNGTTLNVYEFSVAGGNALATLGVDSDIAVTTANVPVA